MLSCQRNALNLDLGAFWQLLYCNTASRRLCDKMLLVFCVELCKIGHVRQEAIDLDNSFNAGPCSGKDALDVGNARCGKVGNAAFD